MTAGKGKAMSNSEERKHPDHESDPAHTPGDGWGEEGGASHLGPATHTDPEHAEEEQEQQ